MARDKARDLREIVQFSKDYVGKTTADCIEAYALKRKIVVHRAGAAFWEKADAGEIRVTYDAEGMAYVSDLPCNGKGI